MPVTPHVDPAAARERLETVCRDEGGAFFILLVKSRVEVATKQRWQAVPTPRVAVDEIKQGHLRLPTRKVEGDQEQAIYLDRTTSVGVGSKVVANVVPLHRLAASNQHGIDTRQRARWMHTFKPAVAAEMLLDRLALLVVSVLGKNNCVWRLSIDERQNTRNAVPATVPNVPDQKPRHGGRN